MVGAPQIGPPMLQGCLNGGRSRAEHPGIPVTPAELARAAASAAALGVGSVHVHPRDERGAETVAGLDVARAVAAIRGSAPDLEIGVTTAAWIEPEPRVRLEQVTEWGSLDARPDIASVNVHEQGWAELCSALGSAGIGVELGVFHVGAARTLRQAGVPANAVRVLAEVQPTDPAEASQEVSRLLDALAGVELPILLHGEDAAAWPVLEAAVRRSLDTRIGLEDTLWLPDGSAAVDNAALLDAARRLLRHPAADRRAGPFDGLR